MLAGLKGGNRLLDGTSKHSFESQIAELHKQCSLKEVFLLIYVCLNRGVESVVWLRRRIMFQSMLVHPTSCLYIRTGAFEGNAR